MKKTDGLTLVELIVTLVVAAIVLAASIPGMRNLMSNSQAMAHTDSLITALSFTRSESVKRGISVSLCAKSTAKEADTTCGEGDDWPNGWLAFLDTSDGTLLRSWPAPPGNYSITGPARVRFSGTGAMQSSDAVTFTIEPTPCAGEQKRTITIEPAGYSSVTKEPCT